MFSKSPLKRFLLPALLVCAVLRAQSPEPPHAVPLSSEPSHHLAFENEYVRVFNVAVAPHTSTLLHQHDVDYLYVILGPADVVNAVLGKPEVHLQLADGEVHFSRGPFAHVARNEADKTFRNVTIELLRPQGPARNLCGKVVPEDLGPCPESQAQPQAGSQADKPKSQDPPNASSKTSPKTSKTKPAVPAPSIAHHSAQPWFETGELLITFMTVEPAIGIRSSAHFHRLVVALEQSELEVSWPHKRPLLLQSGNVRWIPADADAMVANVAAAPSRFLFIYFKDTPGASPPPVSPQPPR